MRVFYRADGSAEIGTGHLLRGILIGQELRRTVEAELIFCARAYPWAERRLQEAGFAATWLPLDLDPDEEVDAARSALAASDAQVVAVDILDTGTSPDICARLGEGGLPVITFDNTGEGRLTAGAIINFLVRDPAPETVRSRRIALHEGPEYATLVPEYAGANEVEHPIAPVARRLLVSLGGGDAAGLTLKVLRAVQQSRSSLEVTVVVGSAYPHRESLDLLAASSRVKVTVRQNVASLLEEFRRADMAVVAGGLTMHEALATGTPALALCQEVWHQEFLAGFWSERGVMVDLGPGADAGEQAIASAIDALAVDAGRREAMSRAGQRYVDGKGTARVARILMEAAGGRDRRGEGVKG
jgi:spore coat polysaccharide biosynthesis predicted glycosyltransferase SpsG